ncbi:MAG: SPOR domain-containing protein [Spirochaetaceae bacterium]|jgi:hypothetical protein|nr:SPOR domain-containing protein [Spirochaetaceae bacterium]
MKKIGMTLGIMVSSFFFLSAVVWEGIARTAPEDQFFEKGYAVATNSFPPNTVVEMTNLENGRTIQVIVISGLGPSGFLAMFSPDAASAIGAREQSPVKIRITQPRAPDVSFRLTWTDNSGEKPSAFVPAPASKAVLSPVPEPTPASIPEGAGASASGAPAPVPKSAPEPVLIPPNFTGIPHSREAAPDISITSPRPEERISQGLPPSAASPPPSVPPVAAQPQNPPPRDPAQGQMTAPPTGEQNPQGLPPSAASPPPPVPPVAVQPQNPPPLDPAQGHEMTALPAGEQSPQGLSPNNASPPPVPPVAAQPQNPLDPSQRYEVILLPAEERPPAQAADFRLLPPEAEIAPLGPLPTAESVPEEVPSGASKLSLFSPSLENAAFGRDSFENQAFSVPVITSLEMGKYYLQLGAFGMIELAEAELSRIGKKYPLAIQSDGNPYAPIYRILLGPVSLGESGALIQHFKSIGYSDAFVRQGP